MVSKRSFIDGFKVSALRKDKGWTQGELAYHSSVDQSLISRIETGIVKDVNLSTAVNLAKALSVDVSELVSDNGQPRRPIGKRSQPPMTEEEPLLDFHIYIQRKFKNKPIVQQTLIAAYEAIARAEEELEEQEKKRLAALPEAAQRAIRLGKMIAELRNREGLSEQQLAEKAEVEPRLIYLMEYGAIEKPERRALEKIAGALGVPGEVLLEVAGM